MTGVRLLPSVSPHVIHQVSVKVGSVITVSALAVPDALLFKTSRVQASSPSPIFDSLHPHLLSTSHLFIEN